MCLNVFMTANVEEDERRAGHGRNGYRVCVVPHRGHDQVRAVERNQARLGQRRAWVDLLDSW